MIYIVSKTSQYGQDYPPFENSFKHKHENWQTRSCTEEYFDKNHSAREGSWRSNGKNHKTCNEGKWITRQHPDVDLWSIEINSLEELLRFIEDNGRIIIGQSNDNGGVMEIEIYDDYRE